MGNISENINGTNITTTTVCMRQKLKDLHGAFIFKNTVQNCCYVFCSYNFPGVKEMLKDTIINTIIINYTKQCFTVVAEFWIPGKQYK